MGDIKITGLIGENEIQTVKELDSTLERVKATYVDAAKELSKGLKINVEVVGDLDKLNTIYVTQSKNAKSASDELTDALKKQSEMSQEVARRLDEQVKAGNLSATEMKKVTAAGTQNAAAIEKMAKAEATLEKAQNSSTAAKKKASLTEAERLKLIREAILLSNQEVHSRAQAKEINKQLQKAVEVLNDTDEGYIRTLARLNSTIGVNTDYVKRNSDRYTQQKMTIGDYREQVKAAIIELENGNKSMKNMGVIAKNSGMMLKSHLATGLDQVHVGMKGMISGYVGAQAVIMGVVKLFTQLREGVGSIVEFEFANSRLAAILGTTSNNIKELTTDAQRLGATTKYTAAQATDLQIELAKLGFTRREILESTSAILRFAQATGAELADAAALSGAALRMFNASTKETERYVSSMAVATSRSALSFSYLATALPIVGPVAKAFNFTIEDTLALLGKLADAGFDASMSATATRNILLNLADGSGALAKALGAPVKTLPDLVAGLQKLKNQGVDLNTTLELTDKRSVAAFNAFLTAADKIVPLRNQITGVDGELADMANTMSDNVKGAVAGLSSAWEAFMLSFYGSKGVMKDVLDFFAKGLREVATQLKSYSQLQDEADNKAVALAQKEMAKSDYLEKNTKNMQRLYKEYINSGMSADEAAKKSKEDYIKTLKSRLEFENTDYQLAIDNRTKLEGELKDRGLFTILTSWRRTNNVIKEDIDVATKAAAGKKAIHSITESLLEQLNAVNLNEADENKTGGTKALTDKEKKELEKAAKEKLKIHETYLDSELSLMDEGLEKELKKIGIEYSKKIAAVKGYGKEEIATRQNIAKEMQQSLDDFTIKYNEDREKKDIDNALDVVRKGSKEELHLKLRQLELQREAEIDAAEKTGEDVFLIDEKYAKKRQQLFEKNTSDQIVLIAENAAHEQQIRDQEHILDMLALKKKLASKQITQQKYAEQEYALCVDYARKTAEAAIDALELELKADNLSVEDRTKIAEQLQKLKADLAKAEAEAEIDSIEKVTKADERAQKERLKNLNKWLQTASQAIGAIGDLVGAVYDGQIENIETEQDANDEAYEREVERYTNQAEQGAISEEEAEARKRSAKALTEAKNEELEKKKQEVEHKQAVWNKGVQVAQTGIATARGIMEAWQMGPAGAIFAAIVAAMGAIQIATILATPIPAYAEGTKENTGHSGGMALVGDAGRSEVVTYNGMAWITPDTPTLVDLPKGALVFPDVDNVDLSDFEVPPFSLVAGGLDKRGMVVFNDYSRLETKIDRTNYLLQATMKQQHKDAYNREYEYYKRDRA